MDHHGLRDALSDSPRRAYGLKIVGSCKVGSTAHLHSNDHIVMLLSDTQRGSFVNHPEIDEFSRLSHKPHTRDVQKRQHACSGRVNNLSSKSIEAIGP